MPTLEVYALGQGGVNVNVAPTEIKPEEARQLQNVILDTDEASSGLRKRGGLQKFNSSAINSGASILGGTGVPLPDPNGIVRTLYAALGTSDSDTWASTTDGTSWIESSTIATRQSSQTQRTIGAQVQYSVRGITFKKRLYYPADTYTVGTSNPSIYIYDGTNNVEVVEIPKSPIDSDEALFVSDMALHGGEIYVAVADPGGSSPDRRGRVLHFNHETGAFTQIGPSFSANSGDQAGGYPVNMVSFMGQLFVCTYGITGGNPRKVWRIRPFQETTWTADLSETGGYGRGLAVFQGNLYMACGENASEGPVIRKRTPLGAWSTVESETGSGNVDHRVYENIFVWDDALYAHFYYRNSGGLAKIVRSADGTTWTDDFDIYGAYTADYNAGTVAIYNNVPYVTLTASGEGTGRIIRRSGGSWASVFTGNLRGITGIVEVQT